MIQDQSGSRNGAFSYQMKAMRERLNATTEQHDERRNETAEITHVFSAWICIGVFAYFFVGFFEGVTENQPVMKRQESQQQVIVSINLPVRAKASPENRKTIDSRITEMKLAQVGSVKTHHLFNIAVLNTLGLAMVICISLTMKAAGCRKSTVDLGTLNCIGVVGATILWMMSKLLAA